MQNTAKSNETSSDILDQHEGIHGSAFGFQILIIGKHGIQDFLYDLIY